ncbi:MAG: hypothetical protein V3V68_05215 [Nitrosomonadaceae bacterium]
MKYFSIYAIVVIILIVIDYNIYNSVKSEQSDNVSIIQQLIDDKIELEIVISEQDDIIHTRIGEVVKLEKAYAEITKAALEVAGENYALHQVLEETVVSMKQMFEYIKQLEEELRDRDA